MSLPKLKVLQVTDALGGGVLSSVANICNYLDRGRFEAVLAYTPREEAPSEDGLAKIFRPDVRRILVPAKRKIDPAADLRTFRHYYRIMAHERPDIIHLHSSKAGFLGRWAALIARFGTGSYSPRIFYSPRGFSFLRRDVSNWKRGLFWMLERFGAALPGTIVAVSATESEKARTLIRPERIRLVENAVDLRAIDQALSDVRRPTSGSCLTIATVGRTTPAKDPSRLLKIVDEARRQAGRPIRFLWIGGGALTSDAALERGFRQELKRRGLQDSFHVTGWMPREEAWRRLFGEVDIYLQISLWEGMPLGILEAFACGKPVVANDVIGNRDAVRNGVTGLLAAGDGDLVRHLVRLAEDDILRQKLGRAARREAEGRFSAQRVADQLKELYLDGE